MTSVDEHIPAVVANWHLTAIVDGTAHLELPTLANHLNELEQLNEPDGDTHLWVLDAIGRYLRSDLDGTWVTELAAAASDLNIPRERPELQGRERDRWYRIVGAVTATRERLINHHNLNTSRADIAHIIDRRGRPEPELTVAAAWRIARNAPVVNGDNDTFMSDLATAITQHHISDHSELHSICDRWQHYDLRDKLIRTGRAHALLGIAKDPNSSSRHLEHIIELIATSSSTPPDRVVVDAVAAHRNTTIELVRKAQHVRTKTQHTRIGGLGDHTAGSWKYLTALAGNWHGTIGELDDTARHLQQQPATAAPDNTDNVTP